MYKRQVVDLFKFVILKVTQCASSSELGTIVVPVTVLLDDLQLEVSTFPEAERIDGFLILELRFHCLNNLVVDLLTVLVEEDTTLVLRVKGILDNIDVGVVRQLLEL